jgi:hypothetical protein
MISLPFVDVMSVKALPQHRIWVSFSDGAEGEADLSLDIQAGGSMVEPLKNEAYFARVFVERGAPTWPNGYDIDPIALYVEIRDAGRLRRASAAE